MRFFFKSTRFKIIAGITAGLLLVAVAIKIIGGVASPQAGVLGTIVAPFQKLATNVSNKIEDIKTAYFDGQELMEENQQLKEEINRLTSQLLDYQKAIDENRFYKDYLEIKDRHPDFQFEPAMLISRDNADSYGGFTIDKGSIHGISAYDPVITAEGLVGYISEVAPSYSKVTTILSPNINIGAFDRRTRDSGIVSGSFELAQERKCKLYNLPRTCSVTIGDYIVTYGGSVFPEGLLIGTVEDVRQDENDISVYSVINPAVNIDEIRDVMVITYFTGQSSSTPQKGG